jgi:hypothetical protein
LSFLRILSPIPVCFVPHRPHVRQVFCMGKEIILQNLNAACHYEKFIALSCKHSQEFFCPPAGRTKNAIPLHLAILCLGQPMGPAAPGHDTGPGGHGKSECRRRPARRCHRFRGRQQDFNQDQRRGVLFHPCARGFHLSVHAYRVCFQKRPCFQRWKYGSTA